MMAKIAKAYQSTNALSGQAKGAIIVVVLVISIIFTSQYYHPEGMTAVYKYLSAQGGKKIRATTWNIAAINNNPFEYWITNEDPVYNRIMKDVSAFIESPGDNDVAVKNIFSEKMVKELMDEMSDVGWGVEETQEQWDSDYKNRKIITEFIKDGLLGKKRLASMPDRVTNSINTVDEGVVTRPTVINCYSGDLSTMDSWWDQWKQFMFHKEVTVKKQGVNTKTKIIDMITPIKKSKYPAISAEEEKISLPLQVMCAAIFDAILVHMMNTIASKDWQPLREDMCNKLNRRKHERTIQILETTYADSTVQFLQEVASSFAQSAQNHRLTQIFDLYYPAEMDSDRDQNSFILLKKSMYSDVKEVTSEVLEELKSTKTTTAAPVANGDLLVLTAVDITDKTKYLFASFHGDTNGLATIPVVTAVHNYAIRKRPDHKLLFGMDANTYAHPESDQQGVLDFAKFYTSMKLNTCYGPTPNPLNFTTFHARTHLQPQLNKAVTLEEKDIKGDKNPKDFVLFFASDFNVLTTSKDNTGQKKYVENMVFPTLTFPSDHGVTSTILQELETSTIAAMEASLETQDALESNPVEEQLSPRHLNTKPGSLRQSASAVTKEATLPAQ